MIRSMTGFGAADGVVGGGRVSVEVRSVNHRFFSPSIKLPSVLARWESDVREALRRKVSRGHVTLGARFEREGEEDVSPIDESRFAAYVAQLRALQEIFDEAWLQIVSSSNLNVVADWRALRDDIACMVMDYAQSSLTDDEIIRAILASLGIQ